MKQKFLVILCVFFAVQMAAWAQEKSGYCGDPAVNEGMDVKWELSEDGVLTISGVGAMADYDGNSPWKDYNIEKVEIAEGVTSIGGYAFCKCYELISVTIPNSVTSIGSRAFSWCFSLLTITCLNPVPPTLGLDAFTEISYDPILRVPDVEAYKASDWAEYFSIFEQIDPTVISDIEVDREAPTTIYDLSGRRVTEPVKGRIYIVDGKTVVW